jgi:uncharacterized membrane protein
MRQETRFRPPLYWQSQLLLLIVVPVCCIWIFFQTVEAWERRDPVLVQTAGICIFFGLAVWIARAGTVPAIFTGVLVTACLYLRFPGRETALWCLVAMLTLTLAATRFGVAALACLPAHAPWVAAAGVCAALSESTADTLSSELGQVFGGRPRLMTTFRPVATGTDGGITLAGTACGCLGAATIAAVSAWTFHFNLKSGINVFSCGALGLFLDSLLGATLERRGLLNNDAVNFLSTLASALCAERIAGLLGR